MTRTPSRGLAIGAGLASCLLLLSACSGGSSQSGGTTPQEKARGTASVPAGSPPPLPVVATARPGEGQRFKVTINRIRISKDGFAVLRWTIENTSGQTINTDDPYRNFNILQYASHEGPTGVDIVDRQSGKRYHPLSNSDRACLCAELTYKYQELAPGQRLRLYDTYLLPPKTKKVTVEIPGFEPVRGVKVER